MYNSVLGSIDRVDGSAAFLRRQLSSRMHCILFPKKIWKHCHSTWNIAAVPKPEIWSMTQFFTTVPSKNSKNKNKNGEITQISRGWKPLHRGGGGWNKNFPEYSLGQNGPGHRTSTSQWLMAIRRSITPSDDLGALICYRFKIFSCILKR